MQLPLRSLAVSFIFLLILTFALSAQLAQEVPPGPPILGFSPPHAAAERQLESTFQSIPSPEKAREWHRTFTAEPHPAASERNNQLADFVADAWRKQGWEDVMLRRYDVLHSRPRSISLEMTEPVHFTASLREDAYDVDPDTKNPAASGSFFGYSASGDVTAEVVYAHSGNPEDYDVLRKNGISGRRYRRSRLRAQRQSRRLRCASKKRHQRERQNRSRPLFESLQLSRLQGAHR